MKFITGGSVIVGLPGNSPYRGFDDLPHKKKSVGDYCVDYYEYPNSKGSKPKTNVNYHTAAKLCKKRGKRLCTEAEWERSCKGPRNLAFPYGNQFNPNYCSTQDVNGKNRKKASAGKFSRCRGAYGTSDMSGNVSEWVKEGVTKGGAADRPKWAVTCSSRAPVPKSKKSGMIGFRCCANPQ